MMKFIAFGVMIAFIRGVRVISCAFTISNVSIGGRHSKLKIQPSTPLCRAAVMLGPPSPGIDMCILLPGPSILTKKVGFI